MENGFEVLILLYGQIAMKSRFASKQRKIKIHIKKLLSLKMSPKNNQNKGNTHLIS